MSLSAGNGEVRESEAPRGGRARGEAIELVVIPSRDNHKLRGILDVPSDARAMVVLAQGKVGSRFNVRHQHLARRLQLGGLGTLLVDLLDDTEDDEPAKAFDVELLAHRLADATLWLDGNPQTASLPIAYLGVGTGAAASLVAAALSPSRVLCVVSRAGRPDLAREYLGEVKAPTLLIVGGHDLELVLLNRECLGLLSCDKSLSVIPGASQRFVEPGAPEALEKLTLEWIGRSLAPIPVAPAERVSV